MARVRRPYPLSVHRLEARDVPAAVFLDPGSYRPDRVIVTTTNDQAPRSPLVGGVMDLGDGQFAVQLRTGVGMQRGLVQLRSLKGVAAVEPDYRVRAALTPNDPSFGSLWGLNNTGQSAGTPDADIDAAEAWDVSTGAGSRVVGVIDTGIDYRHPDLYLNVWINQAEIPAGVLPLLTDVDGDSRITFRDLNEPVNQGPGLVTDLNANARIDAGDILPAAASGGWSDGVNAGENGYTDDLVGWNFVNNTNNPLDDNGHGTHVSGTIAAIGDNGVGVAGVNWRGQVAALKFLNSSGSGSTSGAINALNYAVATGIPITNNSWGGGGFSTGLNTAIGNANNAGHIFVAAAGNAGTNNDSSPFYPANYNFANVVSVGSSTRTDARSSFSNYGATTVDLFAPGSSILSTYPNNGYATLNGTSMASPHVAGAAALVWDAHPDWTGPQVINAIKSTVDVKPAFQGISVTGGRLNVDRAIRFGQVVDAAGPQVTAAAFNGPGPISAVRVTFSEAINAGSFTAADAALVGPGGLIPLTGVAPVAGTGSTQFDLTFAAQTVEGTYEVTIGPGVTDGAGNPMNQDGDGTNGETPDDQFTAATAVAGVGPRVTAAAFAGTTSITSARFTFNEAIDPTTFDLADVTFTGPAGPVAATGVGPVAGTNNQFDVTFDTQSAPGAYTMTIGPDVADAAGNPMDQNTNGTNGEVPGDQFAVTRTLTSTFVFGSTDVNKAIVDVGTTVSVLTINQDATIADLNLTMNLTHTWDSDLRVSLVAPDGTRVILVNRRGGSGDNFNNTTFDDEATRAVSGGLAPFTGSYRAEQALTAFDGKNIRGTWRLVVDDLAAFDVGRINAWSLTVRT